MVYETMKNKCIEFITPNMLEIAFSLQLKPQMKEVNQRLSQGLCVFLEDSERRRRSSDLHH